MLNILNHPENMTHSPDYSMTVNGQPVYLNELPGWAGGTISLAYFEMDEPVNVEIKCNSKIKTAAVHPLSAGIETTVENNVVSFTLDKPRNLSVMFNDCFALPIYIFASEPHVAPDENDENVIYYKAGIHNVGNMELKSGQTLWLDDGAVLNATIRVENAENVKICGRGIIRTSYIPFGGGNTGAQEVVGFINCKNVYMEGVTILDSFSWTVVTYNCENVHLNNVRIINERPWSTDGINPCNSAHVLIENCFARTKDDCLTIKGFKSYGRPADGLSPVEDIVVKNCVFWSDNNNAVVVGSETLAKHVRDIHFIDCDILKATGTCADRAGAIAIICLHDGDVGDITFEGINVEYTEIPLINVFYTDEIFRIPGMRREEGGIINNLLFKDINLVGGPFRWSYIRGMDDKRMVDNVTIENCSIFGKKVEKAEDMELECSFVSGLNIL